MSLLKTRRVISDFKMQFRLNFCVQGHVHSLELNRHAVPPQLLKYMVYIDYSTL